MCEFDEVRGARPVVLTGLIERGKLAGWAVRVTADVSGEGWHLLLYAPGDERPTYDAYADEWADVFEYGESQFIRWEPEGT